MCPAVLVFIAVVAKKLKHKANSSKPEKELFLIECEPPTPPIKKISRSPTALTYTLASIFHWFAILARK